MMRGDPGPWVSPDLALVAYLLHSQDQVQGRVSSLASNTTWSLAPPPARQVTSCPGCCTITEKAFTRAFS